MALELRPNCECCDRDLPPDAPDAFICTFECTFCLGCASGSLGFICPNCGGELTRRPIRPAAKLARNPASTVRVRRQDPCRSGPASGKSTSAAQAAGAINFAGIESLSADEARGVLPSLVALLRDAVMDGASVGFVVPLPDAGAENYWRGVIAEVAEGSRLLLVSRSGGTVAGSVQLGLCLKPNGAHRAEVQKLLVHTTARRQGLGARLMNAIEAEAMKAGRTLLVLDTEPGRPADAMYRRLGWQVAGEIPDFARTPDGVPHPTVVFYKRLAAADRSPGT